MAGQKVTKAQRQVLEEIGEPTIQEMVMNGSSVRDILTTLGVSSMAYYKWLDDVPGRRERITQARELYAEGLDAEAMEIADTVPPDRDEIQRAKLRIDARKHRAAMADRSRQASGQVNVNLGIGELHLEAVRQVGGGDDHPAAIEADYEIEGEDDETDD